MTQNYKLCIFLDNRKYKNLPYNFKLMPYNTISKVQLKK